MSYPGQTLGASYPSAEKQSVYSAALADWAIGHSLGKSSAEMLSVFSTAPVDWTEMV